MLQPDLHIRAKEGAAVNHCPIAVFDSGLGGLSVVRHLRQRLPAEEIVYFGDTARVPYGTKSRDTVAHFALEIARYLLRYEPKLLVAACNSASALALDVLVRELPLPVLGVVEPGARAAVRLAGGRPIAVLGTEATIASGAYPATMLELAPDATVVTQACPLFVPLVEEGRDPRDPLVALAVEQYCGALREMGVGVVVLGCTHYPLLRPALAGFFGPDVAIVDSGQETGLVVQQILDRDNARAPSHQRGCIRCHVSDNPQRFQRVGSRFLDETLHEVQWVEPEQYLQHPAFTPREP